MAGQDGSDSAVRPLALFCTLYAFWFLLSGETSTFLLVAGAVCCAGTVWFSTRLGIVGDEGQPTRGLLPFLAYLPWLVGQVVLANLDVIRRVWRPKDSIDPRLFRLPIRMRHPVAKALYANSITLTPGTVTVQVEPDALLVHSLTAEAEQSLRSGAMEARILRMEEVST